MQGKDTIIMLGSHPRIAEHGSGSIAGFFCRLEKQIYTATRDWVSGQIFGHCQQDCHVTIMPAQMRKSFSAAGV